MTVRGERDCIAAIRHLEVAQAEIDCHRDKDALVHLTRALQALCDVSMDTLLRALQQ